MGLIGINELQPGMKLERPVVSLQGALLAAQGIELTLKHIRLFKTWGVTEADVEGVNQQKERMTEEQVKALEESIDAHFQGNLHDAVMNEIARVAKKLLTSRRQSVNLEPADGTY